MLLGMEPVYYLFTPTGMRWHIFIIIRELFGVYEQSQWVQSSARIQSLYLLWKFSMQCINNDGSDFYSFYWEQCVHFPFESIIVFSFLFFVNYCIFFGACRICDDAGSVSLFTVTMSCFVYNTAWSHWIITSNSILYLTFEWHLLKFVFHY